MATQVACLAAAVGVASVAPIHTPACYVDCNGSTSGCAKRLLPHTVTVRWDNMTIGVCRDECRSAGFSLAGVEASYGCFCGNSIETTPAVVPSTQCCAPCTGNTSQCCGNKYRIWIFDTVTENLPLRPAECHTDGIAIDPRDIHNGTTMLASGYLDQPYCDVATSGRFVCSITADVSGEGGKGEHIAALWSEDGGETWSKPVYLEPEPIATELANAYSMTIAAPGKSTSGGDRFYVIYNMNLDNVTKMPDGTRLGRTDMLGKFVMRYSDDLGETWSESRYIVPNPLRPIDKENEWGGNETVMWTVDQTKVRDGVVYFGFTKIGKYILGPPEELWVLASPNLLNESDPSAIKWELLPSSEHGISLSTSDYDKYNFEEAHVIPMSSAGAPGFYMEGRTTMGYIMASETNDGTGRGGWTTPAHPAQYWEPLSADTSTHSPLSASTTKFGGVAAGLKNPRGPTTLKRFQKIGNGRYLLLYYNNHNTGYTNSRNPYWLASGVEVPSTSTSPATILFSQPEVAIYNAIDHGDRPGYPDFIEWHDHVLITETQKTISRVHKVPDDLVAGLFLQDSTSAVPFGAAVNVTSADRNIKTPLLPALDGSAAAQPGFRQLGFAVGVALEGVGQAAAGEVLFDSSSNTGAGVTLAVDKTPGLLTLSVSDGSTTFKIGTDPACSAVLASPGKHVYGAVMDGGATIATVFVDGVLCDGAGVSNTGWQWFPPLSSALRGDAVMQVIPNFKGVLHRASWWCRMVSTSEMVALARAWLK